MMLKLENSQINFVPFAVLRQAVPFGPSNFEDFYGDDCHCGSSIMI